MRKVLITGATGFAGQYLAELLLSRSDLQLLGTYHSKESLERVGDLQKNITFYQTDLTDKESVFDLIQKQQPDEIYHLAAQTSPRDSFADPLGTMMTNTGSEIHLFEAMKSAGLTKTRIIVISTSEVYGLVKSADLPVDEQTPLHPVSPYAVSKIASDYLGLQYFLTDKLQLVRVRPFNHIGPRQSSKFVLPSFAKQIAQIEKGLKEPVMKVGNLAARKDFSDVRDIVRGYALLMEKGEAGEVYNIGSGKSVSIQQILDTLLSLSSAKITVEVDPALFRPVDIEDIYCDHTKITETTGWNPEIPLEQTLEDTLDYFRKIV